MISARLLLSVAAASVFAAGCSTVSNMVDAVNPFSSSGPKLAPLPPVSGKADVRTQWTASIAKAGDYQFTPAVVGGVAYVAGRDGSISRLEGGKAVWKINAGQTLSAGVAADSNLVVVGTPKGAVLAFAADSGKPLWKAQVSSEVLATPAVGPDGVAVRSGDNNVFLLDASTGARKWMYQRATPALSIRGQGGPVFADRYVFIGFPGGKLVALALQNGAPVWEGAVALPKGATELDRIADVVAAPVVDGTQICAVAFQGRVACFDMAQGGNMIWSRDISSVSGLTLDGRYLFVSDDKGVVHALDRQSGGSFWKQDKLKGRGLSAPLVRRGLVAVGDVEGWVHFLSREDGSVVGRTKLDSTPVTAALQSIDAGILAQSRGGSIAAIEAQ